ncbi:MAG: B3/4 domain-containing protein [Actinomycetes bacterium]|jgi:DNA/RNA-binding domain of Phe-tRNA-synthetase-like protein
MTISAADWLTYSGVEPAVLERWPGYQVTLVAVDHLDTAVLATVAEELLADAHRHARVAEPGAVDPHTTRWHNAYRDFGVKPRVARPSSDALIRRAVSDKGLPSINVLVDLYNAISILHAVPIGGEDLDRYEGPARLVIATGNEPFHTSNDGQPVIDHPDAGEPIWVDDAGVTCRRWNWRQTNRTAIDHHTTRVGFIIDSLDTPSHTGAAAATRQLCDLLPGAITRIIDTAS